MRDPTVLAALLVLLPACSPGGTGSGAAGGPAPTATDDALSLSVLSVETSSDKTTVEMAVVNGGSRPETISRRYTPMKLVDGAGEEHEGPEQDVEIPAYSSDRIRVEFAGRAQGDQMTLTAGDLTVLNLPTSATRFEAGSTPAVGSLSAVQANHANGSSVRVTGVTFDDTGTTVQVEAVNGRDGEIQLSRSSSDPAHLSDESGRTYPLVPPASNPDLSVEQGQSLRGALRFAGRVPVSVQRLTLSFNAKYGSEEEGSSSPRVVLEIPLASPSAE